ncbi:unnamed protein product, partial [Schistosoma curassoni]|uniref:Uncharacterized protein n=1 Tax=Schistosoma curassoni TaxID=6186 RepID=A0A183KZJ9_9TREM
MVPLQSTVISSLASLPSTNHLIPSDKVVFQQQSNTSLSSNFNDRFNRSPVNSELINFIQQMSEEYKCEAKNKERSINTSKNDDNVQLFKFKDNLSTQSDIVGLVTAPDAFTGKPISSNSTSNSSMLNILYPVSGNTDSMISKMELNQINATPNTSVDNKNDNNINMINTEYVYLPNNSISNIPFIYPMSFTQPSLIYHLKHNESNPINSTKARLAFTNLRHLWRRRDIRLSIKGRDYCAAVRSLLLYGSETWLVRVEDIRRLLVFDHRCLRNIARISWDHRVNNAIVRKWVLCKNGKSLDEVVKLHQLRWLGHVL